MFNLVFCDLNAELVSAVDIHVGIKSVCADYFQVANHTDRPVLMTASNPHFSMGGGLDALFLKHYPLIVNHKQAKGGGMERIQNIVFTITVGRSYRATPEMVEEAIRFAIDNTCDDETLLLSGVGTGIGGMDVDTFVGVLKRCLPTNLMCI